MNAAFHISGIRFCSHGQACSLSGNFISLAIDQEDMLAPEQRQAFQTAADLGDLSKGR
jgi:hypothetical protein